MTQRFFLCFFAAVLIFVERWRQDKGPGGIGCAPRLDGRWVGKDNRVGVLSNLSLPVGCHGWLVCQSRVDRVVHTASCGSAIWEDFRWRY
ncbi:MAG: hypothetical protein A2W31_04000 [Planctomycetes bacterium RBG_16_64_10]|nr:MAG: hypothetical protein A2W31_04000 [Planctomycetes bacterium RBG_16_64_10]